MIEEDSARDELCAELRSAARWGRFERIFGEEPPGDEVDGLRFGPFNPYYEDRPTADMYVAGAVGAFAEPETWAEDLTWTPRAGRLSRSQVLDEIYRIAYWNAQPDGWAPGLGNDAEHPLCLTYAALVVRWLATTLPSDLLLGGASERVLQVGFDSGDVLQIGRLSRRGLALPTRRHDLTSARMDGPCAARPTPCREAPTGSAHQVKAATGAATDERETTMPKHLLHDETTPQELAGGRS